MKEYLEKSSKILDELQTTEQGLSEAEAARRLSEHGPNRLAAGKKKSNLQRFFEELKDPMILILLAAALISGITSAYEGESYADVVIILTVVIINAVLGVLQESKAEKAIEALQEIAAATSKVMRGGKIMIVGTVPGDSAINFLKINREVSIQTVFRYANRYPVTIEAISSGRFDVKSMVTHIYDYEDVQRAFDESVNNKREIIKGVIKVNH